MIEKKRIQIRRDLDENWVNTNPILLYGEIGFDLTNNKIKIGDGEKLWNELSWVNEIDLSIYYTKEEINTILNELNTNLFNNYYNKEQVYTKEETDTEIQNTVDGRLSDYYTKEQVYTKEETDTEIQNTVDGRLSDYYTKEQVYTKSETITEIQNVVDNIDTSDNDWFGTQEEFDSLGDYDENTTYYVETNSNNDVDIDLSDYYTKEQTYNKEEVDDLIANSGGGFVDLSNYYTKAETNTEIFNYVDNRLFDYYPRWETDIQIQNTVDSRLSDYYTKSETNTEIQNAIDSIEIPTTDLSNYYNKQEINNIVGLINNELEIIING